ncbi:MAG TPA: SRPBCC family protein [Microthrixaceae bacterium]|nr:SRPBCC family protein [Microthrixaceae bacterium]MCO5306269.1 SRPBCC family protein [Microthrixaceae bacterium]HMU80766.1 SRPBCC family protein [Microthrixaceae bacterium]HMV72986.1 SRPBCC family protein [Microthrixaceae bacterium]HMY87403.1 SRPBCC family protein [Microthrixaceae bacterium]
MTDPGSHGGTGSHDGAGSYDGTLERTATGGTIRFERHLRFPVAAVWDAITNPERLADWWLPFDADITVDLREGGEMVFTSRSGEPGPMTATVLRVEAPVLFEHTHFVAGSTLLWELEAADDGCVLRLTQQVDDVAAAVDGCWVVGLHTSLERLAPAISGSPVPWDWDAFAAAREHYAAIGAAAAEPGS